MKPVKSNASKAAVRILKICTCSTLSGASTLTYHLGCTPKSEAQLRIYGNTGGGFFNNDWVPLLAIQQALDKCTGKKPITSLALVPLFRGQSANTPAFLLAVLKHTGLVKASALRRRSYERGDARAFSSEVKTLIGSGVDLKVTDKPQASQGKTKPKAVSKKTPSKSSSKKKV